jgi:serine/threonine protein kinase
MSQEMLAQQNYHLNADVWSLGCIFLELVQLELPQLLYMEAVTNRNFKQDIRKIVTERYSNYIADLICEMLDSDPDTRISSNFVIERLERGESTPAETHPIEHFDNVDAQDEDYEDVDHEVHLVAFDPNVYTQKVFSMDDWSTLNCVIPADDSCYLICDNIYKMEKDGTYIKVSLEKGWGDYVGCHMNGYLYLISPKSKKLIKWNVDGSYEKLGVEKWDTRSIFCT